MLSKKLNELITRTGRGTPMGELMRRYWVPALLSEEIPGPDCPPVQVRILGEELVAFRDSQGRLGLLEEACSHRGTSLYYGRNEECGLRCIYHAWKYDVDGNVLETPAEPPGSRFREKVKHPAYPTRETGGMVFAYLGPRETTPLFPNYSWTTLPREHTYVTKCVLECNYLQGLEGECDSSHLSILHRAADATGRQGFTDALWEEDTAPEYVTEETDFGVRLIALRKAGPEKTMVRVSSFVVPLSCWVPAMDKEVHFYVPIDDTHAWRYDFGFKTDRPVREEDVFRRKEIGPDYRRVFTPANHYMQDRERQRTLNFTGIETFLAQDGCATESEGPLYDRSREHLGLSDKGIIAMRQRLLDAVQRFQDGGEPLHVVTDPARNVFTHVDTLSQVIDGGDWRSHFPHLAALNSLSP